MRLSKPDENIWVIYSWASIFDMARAYRSFDLDGGASNGGTPTVSL